MYSFSLFWKLIKTRSSEILKFTLYKKPLMSNKLNFSILLILTLITTKVEGQFARSFYSTASNSVKNVGGYYYNNKINSISIKNSDPTQLIIMLVELDDKGTTSDYVELSSSLVLGSDHMISGIAQDGNKLLLCVLYVQNTIGKVAYIQLNLDTKTITTIVTQGSNFKRGFVKSEQKQDSLITYTALNTGQVVRLSTSINTPVNSVIQSTGFSTSVSTFSKLRDYFTILIDGNNEFFHFDYTLCKLNSGVFTTVTTPTGSIYSRDFVKNDNGEIILLCGNKLCRYTTDLTLMGQRTFNISPSGRSFQIYHNGVNLINFMNSGNQYTKYLLNDDLSTIDSLKCRDRFEIFSTLQQAGINYLFGSKIEPVRLNIIPSGDTSSVIQSSFVIKDLNTVNIPVFNEYNQNLQFHNYMFRTGHLNSMFMDEPSGVAGLKLDFHNQVRSLIFASQNLLVGVNSNNDTVGVGTSYYSNDTVRYNTLLPGPFTPSSLNSHENTDQYNRGYFVDRAMIDAHVSAISNNDPTYVMPYGIEFWPGNGNISIGQSEQLASFHDENGNGIYEPFDGDYPLIYGNRCFLNVYHQPEVSYNSNSLEVHQYFFMFDCDTNFANKQTMFILQKYFNRSAFPMDSVYVGTFIDYDIGIYADDYIGTNVELGLIYGINGDLFDESDAGELGFSDTVPAMGMMLLKGIKKYDDNLDNGLGSVNGESPNGIGFGDGIDDNEYYGLIGSVNYNSSSSFPYSDPNGLSDFYYPLQGMHLDGTYDQANGIDVKHAYFGNSDPGFYSSGGLDHGNNHSEATDNNPSGDRRIIGGSGPGKLYPMDTVELLTAYVYGIDSTNFTFPLGEGNLFAHASVIRNSYISNTLGCGNNFDPYVVGNAEIKADDLSINIFPNPFQTEFNVTGLVSSAKMLVYDLNGRIVYQKSITNNEVINFSHLSNSIYVVHFLHQEKTYIKRIIKM